MLLGACERNDPIAPDPTVASVATNATSGTGVDGPVVRVRGKVTSAATGTPVAGAIVRIGDAADITGANGRYRIILPAGDAATLRFSATGFVDFETPITLTPGRVTHDAGLARIEVFEFGDFALYVPASVDETRGLILALGGPDTRAFATGNRLARRSPRSRHRSSCSANRSGSWHPAITRHPRKAGVDTDQPAAKQPRERRAPPERGRGSRGDEWPLRAPVRSHDSVRPVGWGSPGLGVHRSESRIGCGPVPESPGERVVLTSGDALGVPTYVVQAELDVFVNNAAITAVFEGQSGRRSALGVRERTRRAYHSLSPFQRQVTIDWMSTILDRRLRGDPRSGRPSENRPDVGVAWGPFHARSFAMARRSEETERWRAGFRQGPTAHESEALIAPASITASVRRRLCGEAHP